jgi:hypothetical protein
VTAGGKTSATRGDEASAEGFVSLYGGGAFTPGFDHSFTGGGRVGYWLNEADSPYIGVAVDGSYFGADGSIEQTSDTYFNGVLVSHEEHEFDFDIDVFPITGLLMFRTPMIGSQRIAIQPYLGVGGGLVVANVKADDLVFDFGNTVVVADFDGTYDYPAFDSHVGVGLHLARWLELFAEYRFLYIFDPDIDAAADSHHVVGGVGFHF